MHYRADRLHVRVYSASDCEPLPPGLLVSTNDQKSTYVRDSSRVNIHSIYALFQRYFRPRRVQRMRELLPILRDPEARILDVGGSAAWWGYVSPATRNITIVNVDSRHAGACIAAGYRFVECDKKALPFGEAEFDLVLSNSVIEHVGDLEDQRRFAAEMVRCGKTIYCQTPNRWFPIEPHLIAPLIHWLPKRFQLHAIRWASIWGWTTNPTEKEISAFLNSTRLISNDEVNKLFPGLLRADERVLGLTKSFVVYRR